MEERRRLAVAVGLVVAVCGLVASMMVMRLMNVVSRRADADGDASRRTA